MLETPSPDECRVGFAASSAYEQWLTQTEDRTGNARLRNKQEDVMSRYTFEGNRPELSIVIGWDNPLASFFAQVWDAGEPEDRDLKLWAGAGPERVTTVEALAALVAPYGE